jgi:hypothetical protein
VQKYQVFKERKKLKWQKYETSSGHLGHQRINQSK